MKIRFQTKEESKKEQREAFLKLTPAQRMEKFFELSRKINQLPAARKKKINPDNFIIDLTLKKQ